MVNPCQFDGAVENPVPLKASPPVHFLVVAIIVYCDPIADSGLLVPSVSSELRAALLSTANQHGLTNSRQLEIIGRAATEIILSLSGGSHRLVQWRWKLLTTGSSSELNATTLHEFELYKRKTFYYWLKSFLELAQIDIWLCSTYNFSYWSWLFRDSSLSD